MTRWWTVALLFISQEAFCQVQVIHGVVYQGTGSSKSPVSNADIWIPGVGSSTTDDNGVYNIRLSNCSNCRTGTMLTIYAYTQVQHGSQKYVITPDSNVKPCEITVSLTDKNIHVIGMVRSRSTSQGIPNIKINALPHANYGTTIHPVKTDEDGVFRLAIDKHGAERINQLTLVVSDAGQQYKGNRIEVDVTRSAPVMIDLEEFKEPITTNLAIRKELAALNLTWNYSTFVEHLYNNDSLIVSLFCRGGIKLRRPEFIVYFSQHYSDAITTILLGNNSLGLDCCNVVLDAGFYSIFEEVRRSPEKGELLRKICARSMLESIDSLIIVEKVKIEYFKGELPKLVQSGCINDFKQDQGVPIGALFYKYYEEAARFNILDPITYTNRQSVLATLNIALMTRNDAMMFEKPLDYIKAVVKQYCPEFYTQLETDPYTLELLQFSKGVLLGK